MSGPASVIRAGRDWQLATALASSTLSVTAAAFTATTIALASTALATAKPSTAVAATLTTTAIATAARRAVQQWRLLVTDKRRDVHSGG